MSSKCPKCQRDQQSGLVIVRFGYFYRTSDSRKIQRFLCRGCKKTWSYATFHKWFRQKKRNKNIQIRRKLCSGESIRATAENLHLDRKTVARRLLQLGFESELGLRKVNKSLKPEAIVEFDDLETFEHTKCKPVSVTLMVEYPTRRIIDLEVSPFGAKGRLVEKAKKYGYRRDGRKNARNKLFERAKELISSTALIKSDSNPYYAADVKKHFPHASYTQYLGQRGSNTGQGELKKGGFDPIFCLNHTCATFRERMKRLSRKTWCTTKRREYLRAHLFLFAQFHNSRLPKN